ncbi:hypothetical protein [Roseateles chitosanitabidus]|uniref:hypothetical protein n=1 Tax=Roseateles chitosanitabidus TaxID=65048 RepID=UPI002356F908|nr:hypothetical protein [Roseateles chitosanitabidus]
MNDTKRLARIVSVSYVRTSMKQRPPPVRERRHDFRLHVRNPVNSAPIRAL